MRYKRHRIECPEIGGDLRQGDNVDDKRDNAHIDGEYDAKEDGPKVAILGEFLVKCKVLATSTVDCPLADSSFC